MFLDVKNLSKQYQNKTVLHSLSFQVEQNEMLVVLGPSGCGKSTLLSCLNGFTSVTKGTVSLLGKDITNLAPEKRDITTVFQSYSLFPHMNVRQNLSYGLKFKNISKKMANQKVIDMLKLLQMEKYADSKIQDLSGGQQQRIALGRSLIIEPKLLLLDEPFSNLDEKLRLKMREELLRIKKELNMTMIFVTHDQQEAFAIGDKILLMDHGHIQQIDNGQGLYSHPKNQFVLNFIGESNMLSNNEYIRPQDITLKKDNAGKGTITQVIFQGATVDYRINYQRKIFKVTCLNQVDNFQVGDRVAVSYQTKKLEEK